MWNRDEVEYGGIVGIGPCNALLALYDSASSSDAYALSWSKSFFYYVSLSSHNDVWIYLQKSEDMAGVVDPSLHSSLRWDVPTFLGSHLRGIFPQVLLQSLGDG